MASVYHTGIVIIIYYELYATIDIWSSEVTSISRRQKFDLKISSGITTDDEKTEKLSLYTVIIEIIFVYVMVRLL